jgi:dinuclear metal center YbgI/SA1388 family protein
VSVSTKKVIDALQRLYPPSSALEGDATGLQVGSRGGTVERVLCTLDLTLAVAEEARDLRAGLVVSHHAVVFRPLEHLRTDTQIGRILATLIKADASVYVPHTALDVAVGGTNDDLVARLGLTGARLLDETGRDEAGVARGIGRVGALARPTSLADLARAVKDALGAPLVRVVARDVATVVDTVAVLAGDGRRYVDAAASAGAQALVTGDVDHHTALRALARGVALIDAGHWATERRAPELMAARLRVALASEAVEVLVSQVSTQPFTYM